MCCHINNILLVNLKCLWEMILFPWLSDGESVFFVPLCKQGNHRKKNLIMILMMTLKLNIVRVWIKKPAAMSVFFFTHPGIHLLVFFYCMIEIEKNNISNRNIYQGFSSTLTEVQFQQEHCLLVHCFNYSG